MGPTAHFPLASHMTANHDEAHGAGARSFQRIRRGLSMAAAGPRVVDQKDVLVNEWACCRVPSLVVTSAGLGVSGRAKNTIEAVFERTARLDDAP